MTAAALEPSRTTDAPRRRRVNARAALLAAGAVAATSAAGAAAIGIGSGGSAQAAAGLPPATVQVTRQTLKDTAEVDAELGYGPALSVSSRAQGTVTWLPGAGAEIGRGQPLYRVDDVATVLLYGAVPAYRPLGPGDSGVDVRQLEQNLADLGQTGFTVDDEYTDATAAAVERWQESAELPVTGRVPLGQVVFAAGAVRIDSVSADPGDPASPGQPLLSYTGTAKVVTVELPAEDQRLVPDGAQVEVTLPDGQPTPGKVAEVAAVVVPGEGPGAEPETRLEVVIAISDQQVLASLSRAAVDVTFTESERADVLAVPVAALVALAEGGFGLQVVDDGQVRYVPVTPGLFAGGMVEISGGGVAEGAVVGLPE
jgi:multidrug efflux system membrane fusion protein